MIEQPTPNIQFFGIYLNFLFKGQKVRALTFNEKWREIAALTLNGYIHVFNAETFKQTISRKLPSCQDLVCLATQVN